MRSAAINACLLLFVLGYCATAQTLPSKIRGYKLYDAKVLVSSTFDTSGRSKNDAAVTILDPAVTDISLSGAIVEVGAEITALTQSGNVDFMTCSNLRVNGVAIEIEEYAHPFKFKEGEKITLPQPARITINFANIAKAAYKELTDPKNDWAVTGTIFVFGKFKRLGMTLKRVIPVKIDLKIKNPLRS